MKLTPGECRVLARMLAHVLHCKYPSHNKELFQLENNTDFTLAEDLLPRLVNAWPAANNNVCRKGHIGPPCYCNACTAEEGE